MVADDKTARPVIYYKEDESRTRFRVALKGAKGEDFVHGDIKPVQGATTFIGKYTVEEGTEKLTIAVGKQSTDLQGTPLGAFYTHKAHLQISQPDTTPPVVTSVTYYADEALTEPLMDTVHPGDTIYTKIVFSEAMQTVVANGNAGRPVLYYKVGRNFTRFHIKPENEQLASGSAKPFDDGAAYLGTYTVADNVLSRPFTVSVGKQSTDLQGNQPEQFYTHPEQLRIAERLPEPTAPAAGPVAVVYGVPREPFSRKKLYMVVGGEGITHYRYAFSRTDQCSEASFNIYSPSPFSIYNPIRLDYSQSAGLTDTLCVIGMDADGVWQEVPTTHRLTYDPAARDILPRKNYTFTEAEKRIYLRIHEGNQNLTRLERSEKRRLTTQDYVKEFGVAFPDVDIYIKTDIRAHALAKALIPDYGQQFEHGGWQQVEILRLWVDSPESSPDEIIAKFVERVEQGVLFALKDVIDWNALTISF